MTRTLHRLGIGALATLALSFGLLGAPGAAALRSSTQLVAQDTEQEPAGRIIRVDAEAGEIELIFEATLPVGDEIDPGSVQVQLGDQQLDAEVVSLSDTPTQVDRQVLLVLDVSESMAGEKLAAAQAAAVEFLNVVPADVKVGLVSFAETAEVLVLPTLDRVSIQDAVAGLTSSRGTALYDALVLAATTLEDADVGNVVLLSDGINTETGATLEDAEDEIQANQIGLAAVNLADSAEEVEILSRLAEAGQGELLSAATEAELQPLFEQSARAIAAQLRITAPVPAGTSAEQQYTVRVEAQAGDIALRDDSVLVLDREDIPVVTAAPEPVPATDGGGLLASQTALIIAALLLFTGLTILLGFALAAAAANRREADVRRRLAHYSLAHPRMAELQTTNREQSEARERISTTGGHSPAAGTILGDSGLARTAVELAERVVATRDTEGKLAARLESAAIPFRAPEWLVLHTAAAVLPGLALLLISGGDIALAVLGLLAGALLPYLYLSFKRSGRRHKFEEQLPATLQLLAGSLSAGYSLPQAVDTVARETSQPVAGEFGRAIMESRLAVPIEDALEHVAERTGSQDFGWVVMAIRIQRQVGGNLAELLTTIAGTLRERERLRRQIRVLSAEGRLSAYILGTLPVVFALYLFVVRRDYLLRLFSEPLGVAMLFVGLASLTVGVFWMKKIVSVEV
ncbi:MAG: type II secretion system F family protein [Sporichthyaceae bacterium]|nr:type II secretion system F family protein [Sporichthyaceae bacterium]